MTSTSLYLLALNEEREPWCKANATF